MLDEAYEIKVLAGEVTKPKSYSLRTLETLRNLTKEHAEIFAKVAQAALKQADRASILNPDTSCKYLTGEFGITFLDVLTLKGPGLMLPNTLQSSLKKQVTTISMMHFLRG